MIGESPYTYVNTKDITVAKCLYYFASHTHTHTNFCLWIILYQYISGFDKLLSNPQNPIGIKFKQ